MYAYTCIYMHTALSHLLPCPECTVWPRQCPLCHTADMSAVSQSRHVCRVTDTGDKSAVSDSTHVCCVTHRRHACCSTRCHVSQRTCRLWHTKRHICCGTLQTCLLCDTVDMSAVSHSEKVGATLDHDVVVLLARGRANASVLAE